MHFNEQAVYNFQAAHSSQIYKYDFFRLNDIQFNVDARVARSESPVVGGGETLKEIRICGPIRPNAQRPIY